MNNLRIYASRNLLFHTKPVAPKLDFTSEREVRGLLLFIEDLMEGNIPMGLQCLEEIEAGIKGGELERIFSADIERLRAGVRRIARETTH
jgi:hypothetical protein